MKPTLREVLFLSSIGNHAKIGSKIITDLHQKVRFYQNLSAWLSLALLCAVIALII